MKHKNPKSSKQKIKINDFGIFVLIHGSHISVQNIEFPKDYNGSMWNGGIGFSYKRQISTHDFIRIELSYIQKGRLYQLNPYASAPNILRLNYFEIPILWSHNLSYNGVKIIIETGFAISFLFLSDNQIANFATEIYEPQAQIFKDFDIPWIFNIKTPFIFNGKNKLEMGLRFSYSPLPINNTNKTERFGMGRNDGMHHMTYGFLLERKF